MILNVHSFGKKVRSLRFVKFRKRLLLTKGKAIGLPILLIFAAFENAQVLAKK